MTVNTNGTCPQQVAGISETAADPYVTAVGGTQFTPNYDSNGNDIGFVAEQVWNDQCSGIKCGASGGGVSAIFGEPAFQVQEASPNTSFRSVPDIALEASEVSPGFWIVDNNQNLAIIGGTSASAPIWAGIDALLAQRAGRRIGNTNPRIYQMGPLGASVGLRDVTTGNNSFAGVTGVSAGPGYDDASGWGTPDLLHLIGTNDFHGFFGEVLISGGEVGSTVLDTAESFGNGAFAGVTFTMSTPRMCHSSTSLNNGKTHVAGGLSTASGGHLQTAEIFTPSSATFALTGNMTVKRADHRAVLLKDGRVLIVGGATANGTITNSAEIYTPATGTFAATGSMSVARVVPSATLLPDGRVLVAGGDDGTAALNSAEVFNPSTGQFALLTATMTTARTDHQALLLDNGLVLLVGGVDNTGAALSSAELFNFVSNSFSETGSMQHQRVLHVISPLHDGRVIVAGGANTAGTAQASAEIYDPVSGTFGGIITMSAGREDPTATTLEDGRVLVAGGKDPAVGTHNSGEIFDPLTNTFTLLSSRMHDKRWRAAANYSSFSP